MPELFSKFWKTKFCFELRDVKFFTNKVAVYNCVTTAKGFWSVSRHDLTSGSHNIGFVCLGCIFYESFLFFSVAIVKSDSLQGVSVYVSNLFFVDIFLMQASNAWWVSR